MVLLPSPYIFNTEPNKYIVWLILLKSFSPGEGTGGLGHWISGAHKARYKVQYDTHCSGCALFSARKNSSVFSRPENVPNFWAGCYLEIGLLSREKGNLDLFAYKISAMKLFYFFPLPFHSDYILNLSSSLIKLVSLPCFNPQKSLLYSKHKMKLFLQRP